MRHSLICDLRHYLDKKGRLDDLPGPMMSPAAHVGGIAAWVTSHRVLKVELTNIHCRRSPGRKRCLGIVAACFNPTKEFIFWECPVCGDNGRISGWEGTLWDRSPKGTRPEAAKYVH